MTCLYVDEPGVGLRLEAGLVQVEKAGETLKSIPLEAIERLALLRNASLSSALLNSLLRQGVPVFFLSGYGRLIGRACASYGKNSQRRLRQVECYRDGNWRLKTARAIVWSKLQGSCDLIDRRLRHYQAPEMGTLRKQIEELALRAATATSLDQLRGFEGQASRLAFAAFAGMFNDETLRPARRSRRPPRDPVNALLSFGYALVTAELAARIEMAGLDPGIGFYHEISYGRESLACDLVEEFRHLVDRMVIGFFNRRQFVAEDFTRDDVGGVRLHDEARKKFFLCYEKALTTDLLKGRDCRDLFELRVREMVAAIEQGRDYVPGCCPAPASCST